jgi:hypothetical protein
MIDLFMTPARPGRSSMGLPPTPPLVFLPDATLSQAGDTFFARRD